MGSRVFCERANRCSRPPPGLQRRRSARGLCAVAGPAADRRRRGTRARCRRRPWRCRNWRAKSVRPRADTAHDAAHHIVADPCGMCPFPQHVYRPFIDGEPAFPGAGFANSPGPDASRGSKDVPETIHDGKTGVREIPARSDLALEVGNVRPAGLPTAASAARKSSAAAVSSGRTRARPDPVRERGSPHVAHAADVRGLGVRAPRSSPASPPRSAPSAFGPQRRTRRACCKSVAGVRASRSTYLAPASSAASRSRPAAPLRGRTAGHPGCGVGATARPDSASERTGVGDGARAWRQKGAAPPVIPA